MVWLENKNSKPLMPWNLRHEPVNKNDDAPQRRIVVDGLVEKRAIPESITNIHLNLKNRQHAIDEYLYGPMNPEEPGDYWQRLGDVWKVDADEAATTRCGNCAAFNRKPEMVEAIADAISDEGDAVTDAAYLGYCELFDFKCAAARSCSAWLTGGPLIKSVSMEKQKEIKVGDFVQWNSSGGTARGKVERIVRTGKADVPDSSFTITAEPDDPALLIRVYHSSSDGHEATDTIVGHKMSSTKRIAALT